MQELGSKAGSNSRIQFPSNESNLVPRNLALDPHLKWAEGVTQQDMQSKNYPSPPFLLFWGSNFLPLGCSPAVALSFWAMQNQTDTVATSKCGVIPSLIKGSEGANKPGA
jgi:hypothetical protein